MVAATHITSVHSWPVVTRHSKGLSPRFYPDPTAGRHPVQGYVLRLFTRARDVLCLHPYYIHIVISLPPGILFNEGRYRQVQKFVLHRIKASEMMAPLRRPRTTGPYRPQILLMIYGAGGRTPARLET